LRAALEAFHYQGYDPKKTMQLLIAACNKDQQKKN
jgi:hypothetical protein